MVTNLNDSELTALGQLEAELTEARATIERVRELHLQDDVYTCVTCCEPIENQHGDNEMVSHDWPCPTLQALDGPSTEGEEQSQ